MTLEELAAEYHESRASSGLLLSDVETLDCALSAARFYAGYGDIKSLSKSDLLQEAPTPGESLPAPLDPVPDVVPSLPIKRLEFVTNDTLLTMGEWAVIRPLFVLYAERENATRLEASRGMGVDVYGRSVSEVAAEIATLEAEMPNRAMVHAIIEI